LMYTIYKKRFFLKIRIRVEYHLGLEPKKAVKKKVEGKLDLTLQKLHPLRYL